MGDLVTANFYETSAPPRKAAAVTKSDSADLPQVIRGFVVGTTGDVKVTFADDADGSSVTLPKMVAGVVHPGIIKRIWSTGTEPTSIIGLW